MIRKFKLLWVTPLVTLSYWLQTLSENIYILAETINDFNVET